MLNLNEQIPAFSIRYLNVLSLAGMIIFCITTVAYYFAISTITRSSLIVFDRDLRYTKGRVVSKAKTSLNEGGVTFNYPVWKVEFIYQVADVIYNNIGYTPSDEIREGDELNISYKESNASISKAATLKASPFGLFVLIGIVLPMSGLLLFLKGLRWGNNFVSMLQNVAITDGQHLSVVSNGEDNKHYYLYDDGSRRKRRIAFETSHEESDEKVRILYDPRNPERAEVLQWHSLPIIFGRNRIRRMLKGS